ncbi:serine protease [Paragemmobacter ruber]|uniref:Peptidoglycan-binding protein n=1 Tax=Paragemmobacter ruber TaxID=1985673 RepID=A0ABW9Y7D1_9RHOB|nr:serine protease [Rhodobacter ruber]NBE08099.1 peptidoglycan-binding protein [Rhodobacter ruber]
MLRLVLACLVTIALGPNLLSPTPAAAQQSEPQVWIQIEAKPNLTEAEERAAAWQTMFDDVQGYRVGSGWHVIALGPFTRPDAEARLTSLRRENLVPRDSFITDGRGFQASFWPVGTPLSEDAATEDATTDGTATDGAAAAQTAPTPDATPEATAETTPLPVIPDETPDQARASESLLSQSERELLQTALKWFGFYDSGIDGAFGRGTRASMAAWQEAMGYEATGILTTFQRDTLVANYQAEQAALGLATVTEPEAGIEVTLPTALVAFDHYEPPFVHYVAKDGSDALRITLISQPGDQSALYGLYDMLQTLEIMPMTGPRERGERSFTLRGESATVTSAAYAELSRGLIKGWIVTWNPAADLPIDRILPAIEASFRPVGDRALDPGIVPMDGATKAGLLSGLEVRKPRLTRSGFFIDAQGRVLTSADAVAQCGRITLDAGTEATVTFTDPTGGIALITPTTPISPPATAEFQLGPDRIGAEIAVAGYSYGDALPAPVLTFGTLEATEGLAGEQGVKRLALTALPGDAGGPVVDNTGAVLGLLLPAASDPARILPEGVAFAATGPAIAATLQAQGVTLAQAARQGALPPEDLARAAARMTVLVSCWE